MKSANKKACKTRLGLQASVLSNPNFWCLVYLDVSALRLQEVYALVD